MVVLTSVGVVARAPIASADTRVSGSAFAGPCLQTAADGYDPVTTEFDCRGEATWLGTWNGVVAYHATGKVDLLTGDGKGTIEERFYGLADGAESGQLLFRGDFTIDGTTGIEIVRLKIVEGSGAFARARGQATFTANSPLSGGPSTGSYTGMWRLRP